MYLEWSHNQWFVTMHVIGSVLRDKSMDNFCYSQEGERPIELIQFSSRCLLLPLKEFFKSSRINWKCHTIQLNGCPLEAYKHVCRAIDFNHIQLWHCFDSYNLFILAARI